MNTVFERLRLTVGLAHAVSGATLIVDTCQGDRLEVGASPNADLDLCTMRRSVIGSARLGRPDDAWADTNLTIGGLLDRHAAISTAAGSGQSSTGSQPCFTPVTFSTESRTSMPTPTLRRSSR